MNWKFWERKEKPAPEPSEAIQQVGLYVIASKNLEERRANWKPVFDEVQAPIDFKEAPDSIKEIIRRIDLLEQAAHLIAVPYLRAMEKENSLFGVAVKIYTQILSVVRGWGYVLHEAVGEELATNKYEIAMGFEKLYAKTVRDYTFTIVAWSFGKFDVIPEHAVMINATGQQFGFRGVVPTSSMQQKNQPPPDRKVPPSLPSEV